MVSYDDKKKTTKSLKQLYPDYDYLFSQYNPPKYPECDVKQDSLTTWETHLVKLVLLINSFTF